MPGEEVKRQVISLNVIQKSGCEVGIAHRRGARSAHFQRGVVFFQHSGCFSVQLVVLFRRAIPEPTQIGLVPYLPVCYVVVVATIPPVVVVHDNVFANLRPFAEVLRRLADAVVVARALSEAVKNTAACIDDTADVVIARCEVVAFLIGRVSTPVREYGAYIRGPVEVVGSYEFYAHFPVLAGDVLAFHVMDGQRSGVDFGVR